MPCSTVQGMLTRKELGEGGMELLAKYSYAMGETVVQRATREKVGRGRGACVQMHAVLCACAAAHGKFNAEADRAGHICCMEQCNTIASASH